MLYSEMEKKLIQATTRDADYQEMRAQCVELEGAYLAILDSLSMEKQQLLECYIGKIEDMEYRRTYLAYCLGLADNHSDISIEKN